MKLKSLIMFSAAALAFAACSNDEDFNAANSGVEGLANVSVRIDEPTLSRAITAGDYTTSTDVTLNTITLTLTSQTATPPTTKTFDAADYGNDRAALLQAVNKYEFTGVRNPSKMEVFINTDKTSGWTAEEFMNAGLAEPLYASSTKFTDKGDIDTDGVKEYEVQLAPQHTMARLEFGGIEHIHSTVGKEPATEKSCMFKTITIDGVILDGVNGVAPANGWVADNLMSYAIGADFMAADAVWPANAQCIPYNIAGDQLPILKVCFSNITINTDIEDYATLVWGNKEGKGYATVKNYKLDDAYQGNAEAFGVDGEGNITKFPAGYIYQVKSLEIPDEAIGTAWEGAEDYHVYAVVTVQPWTIVSGTVEWN